MGEWEVHHVDHLLRRERELRADHFCDFKNEPRYTVHCSPDSNVLHFVMRSATNLDTHPEHVH